MADNVAITAGSGTTVSTEEVTTLNGGVVSAQHVQRVAKAFRTADATAVDAATGAGAVNTGTQRMTLASDDPAVAHLATLVSEAQGTAPVNMYPKPATMVSGVTAAMTGTTSTQVLAAPGASLHNYITAVVISNTHATVDTEVALQDGSSGTTIAVFPAAADYGGATLALPTPLKQPTANTALYCVNLTTGASTKVTVIGYTAAA